MLDTDVVREAWEHVAIGFVAASASNCCSLHCSLLLSRRWETSRHVPRYPLLSAIASALGVSVDELLAQETDVFVVPSGSSRARSSWLSSRFSRIRLRLRPTR